MNGHWGKARRAAQSARLLLADSDTDGAVARAYYCMFHAARAALAEQGPQLAMAKKHATVIRRFGRHIVVALGLPADVGRAISAVMDLRAIADYQEMSVAPADATIALEQMEKFLAAVAVLEQDNQ